LAVFEKVFVTLTILFFLAFVIFLIYIAIDSNRKVEEEKEEYKKSLFRYLNILQNKILKEYSYLNKEPDEVIKEYRDISRKILRLNNNNSTKIDNMRLIDSLAYHELNALKEVNKSLNVGVLLTDEKIQKALIEITKGLNKHYAEFCNIKTANVEEETYILKILEQKKSERLDCTDTSLINENQISESKKVRD